GQALAPGESGPKRALPDVSGIDGVPSQVVKNGADGLCYGVGIVDNHLHMLVAAPAPSLDLNPKRKNAMLKRLARMAVLFTRVLVAATLCAGSVLGASSPAAPNQAVTRLKQIQRRLLMEGERAR